MPTKFMKLLSLLSLFVVLCMGSSFVWSQTDEGIRDAFAVTHDGWSVDEVLIRDDLREQFLRECARSSQASRSSGWDKSTLVKLIQIRKAGKLDIASTKRQEGDLEGVLPAAEIASRQMVDQHQANIDQWLVDPKLLGEFDSMVQAIAPGTKAYDARKGALQLRKTRRLQPELISRVVDWKREILEMTVEEASRGLSSLPISAGIYIFRDATGYLYIGQSNHLRSRLTKHLQDSDRKSLSAYLKEHGAKEMVLELHVFGDDSPATRKVVREAYESDLIRTRKPRLNIAP
jgi:predicted GIY-YIG superfamily endonuclease